VGERPRGGGGGGGNRLYLGVFYSGSFWANVQSFTSTERELGWLDTTKRVPEYAALPAFSANPSNQIAVLIGIADMGFRLSFRTTYQSFKEGNFAVPDDSVPVTPESSVDHYYYKYYKSHETQTGLISHQLAWSMAKNLTGNGIKPWATFDLSFNRAYTKTAEYTDETGNWAASAKIGRSENNIAPELNIGLGGYTFVNKNNWRTSADLEYRLRVTAYNNNEYSYTDDSGINKIKKFKGTYDGTKFFEQSFNDHRIRPSVSTQWNGEKLRLRAKLDLNLIFANTEKNPAQIKEIIPAISWIPAVTDPSGSLVYNGATSDAFNFQFNPDLSLGAQWQIASRFFLNIGGRVNIQALSVTTTEGKEYVNGEAIEKSDYTTTETAYGATQNHLTLGVTINATDNLSVEAATGLSGITKSNNNLNVFSTETTGLFNFASILVSLKF
jgi:hypothetical protein